MKNDIILSGVGGQGILSIANIIGYTAIANNLFLKQSEVHGMSQRGGAVQSNLRISDKPIYSDLIPFGKAELVISVEPMESLRYLPWLSKEGWLVTNSSPFINIPEYPSIDEIIKEIRKVKRSIIIDADSIAKDAGSVRAGNMVILGASSHFMDLPFESIEKAVKEFFDRKGEEVVNINLKALHEGRKFSEQYI